MTEHAAIIYSCYGPNDTNPWKKWIRLPEMTNTEHAITLLNEAKDKYDNGLDPSFQIAQAVKFIHAADAEIKLWRNKYMEHLSGI